jgi:hypothetical protein
MWHGGRWRGLGYVMVGGEAADAIRQHELVRRLEFGRRGMGSVKVHATIGASGWSTSLFPPKGGEGNWFMPVKRAICQAEDLEEGDDVELTIELL